MKNLFLKLIKFAVSPAGAAIAGIAVLAVVIAWNEGGDSASAAAITVERGSLAEEIFVTGKIKPVREAELAFERGGKIARAQVKIGDRVSPGQLLAALHADDLLAELEEANANIAIQEAKLDELKSGTRSEELRIQESRVLRAENSLLEAEKNLAEIVRDAYTKADDAVRNKTSELFSDPGAPATKLRYGISGQIQIDLEWQRYVIELMLGKWRDFLISGDAVAAETYAETAAGNLSEISAFLNNLSLAVKDLTPNALLTQNLIDKIKADVLSGRTAINAAIANLRGAWEKISSAKADLKIVKGELTLKKAGATEEQIAGQAGQVSQAKARVQAVKAQIAKTAIHSPIFGIVTRNEAETGEIASPNSPMITVISESNLEIEANVPEVDVGKVIAGNPVQVTLDAFPGEKFSGKVFFIDPAETVIDGAVNFKVKIALIGKDARLKSGLTANLTIQASKKEGVLVVPLAAVIEKDSGAFVKKIYRGAEREIPIITGIRSQTANLVEIISGLIEGEKILNAGLKPENQ